MVHAQDSGSYEVMGTVTESGTGSPLPGVNVLLIGTTTGTTTNTDGEYQISVNSGTDTLRFSFVGFQDQVVPINGRSTIDIQLEMETFSGDELVVVGYTTQERQNISGSVSSVDVEGLNEGTSGQITKQLQGRASGVSVVSSGQPGEEPDVRIRGINTFGNNSPLYIVDGVPTQSINSLNPSDIESMQVLKDASAASIYGARAANGVIVISTKRGQGDVTIEYNGYAGYSIPNSGNVWNILSPQEMAELKWSAIRNSGGNPAPDPQYGNGSEPVLPDYIRPAGEMSGDVNEEDYFVKPEYKDPAALNGFNQIVRANKQGTDWYDEIFSPAMTMNHDLSVSGGGEIGNYILTLNHYNQQGTLDRTFNERTTIRVNTNFSLSDNFTIGENISYSHSESPQVDALSEGSAIGMSYRQQPIVPVYDIAGNFAGSAGQQLGQAVNPVAQQYRNRNNQALNNRLFGNLYAEVDMADNKLQFRSSFGGEIGSWTSKSFTYPTYENAENNSVNAFNLDGSKTYSFTWSNTLTYQDVFKDVHSLELIVGTEAYHNQGTNFGGSSQGYFSFNPDYTNLSTGAGNRTNYSNEYRDGLLSFFGRVDYNYDSKYIISATLRRDGSSRFENYQWGMFPAGSIGWRISQEPFMQDISWLSELRVRAGYGVMGNQLNVDPNNPYNLYVGDNSSSFYPINGSNNDVQQGFEQSRIGNPDAKWEKNVSGNIGIETILFNDKLEIVAEYYWKDVQDLLFNPRLVGTAGTATPPYVNVANMENRGIDAKITTLGDLGNDFNYNVSLTFTSYQNEIVKISEISEFFSQDSRRFGSDIIRNEVGQPISSFYGYKITGFFNSQEELDEANNNSPNGNYQTDADVGTFRYADINGDNQITADDRTFLGDPNPDFTYGLDIGLNYKRFDLSAFLYGSQGNDIWNQVKWWTDFYSNFAGAKSHAALYDSWTPENKDASLPMQTTGGGESTSTVPNSYFVEDGSYLRMKELVLGYTLPESLIQRISASRLRIYLQASNLFTITGYSGLDPEIGGGNTNFGIDEGAYATPRQFLLGINLSF
ncbi:TonB-dependent receptor [Aliifodinibius sp. S!AR15-10]|uniref:SusC/RagA family TonB-linked outer membrane protein n=1 Tax=Aliifodinibius sp. S!AR15-10 TaxID=2950437 RepID=UPI002862790A|nr:TonB-dependent receptor [Aliifodinibius sp. S!AR15-10]MDR8390052.1 TonB-dependent receptor [Aliifodinibius sp. S!AR15-10]